MFRKLARWGQITAALFVLLMASGCFQQGGDAQSLVTPVPRDLPSPTPLPTNTPLPPPPTETPQTDFSAQNVTGGEPTLDPNLFLQPTADPNQNLSGVDDFSLQATQLVLQATQTVDSANTATALFLGIGLTPTPTPTTFGVGPTQVGQPPSLGVDCIHEVRAGDNLYRLSQTYGVSVTTLAQRNGVIINGEIAVLTLGQRLTIPSCGTTGAFPPPTSTVVLPTTSSITGTTPNPNVTPGVVTGRTHIVREGETLGTIANLYGIDINALAAANGLTNVDFIKMGQTLIIP